MWEFISGLFIGSAIGLFGASLNHAGSAPEYVQREAWTSDPPPTTTTVTRDDKTVFLVPTYGTSAAVRRDAE